MGLKKRKPKLKGRNVETPSKKPPSPTPTPPPEPPKPEPIKEVRPPKSSQTEGSTIDWKTKLRELSDRRAKAWEAVASHADENARLAAFGELRKIAEAELLLAYQLISEDRLRRYLEQKKKHFSEMFTSLNPGDRHNVLGRYRTVGEREHFMVETLADELNSSVNKPALTASALELTDKKYPAIGDGSGAGGSGIPGIGGRSVNTPGNGGSSSSDSPTDTSVVQIETKDDKFSIRICTRVDPDNVGGSKLLGRSIQEVSNQGVRNISDDSPPPPSDISSVAVSDDDSRCRCPSDSGRLSGRSASSERNVQRIRVPIPRSVAKPRQRGCVCNMPPSCCTCESSSSGFRGRMLLKIKPDGTVVPEPYN